MNSSTINDDRGAFNSLAASKILFTVCDMLPPLKSLILKWGLLAQWLY
jgi:hypothetical protein